MVGMNAHYELEVQGSVCPKKSERIHCVEKKTSRTNYCHIKGHQKYNRFEKKQDKWARHCYLTQHKINLSLSNDPQYIP